MRKLKITEFSVCGDLVERALRSDLANRLSNRGGLFEDLTDLKAFGQRYRRVILSRRGDMDTCAHWLLDDPDLVELTIRVVVNQVFAMQDYVAITREEFVSRQDYPLFYQ